MKNKLIEINEAGRQLGVGNILMLPGLGVQR